MIGSAMIRKCIDAVEDEEMEEYEVLDYEDVV